jgi:hypothetical protein
MTRAFINLTTLFVGYYSKIKKVKAYKIYLKYVNRHEKVVKAEKK